MNSKIVVPVALSGLLGPGMGQLYNKEFRKGIVLILLSLALLVIAAIWLIPRLLPNLPADLPLDDAIAMQRFVEEATHKTVSENIHALVAFQIALGILWLYGIIDAYQGARRRLASAPVIPPQRLHLS
jgi:hypothetical protein